MCKMNVRFEPTIVKAIKMNFKRLAKKKFRYVCTSVAKRLMKEFFTTRRRALSLEKNTKRKVLMSKMRNQKAAGIKMSKRKNRYNELW